MTTQEDQDRLAPRCDHKFVDSGACLKCGWTPPPAQNFIASLQQELANLRQIATASDAEIGRLKAELAAVDAALARRPALADIETRYAKIEHACSTAGRADGAEAEVGRLKTENARLTAALGELVDNVQDWIDEELIIDEEPLILHQAKAALKSVEPST